MFENQSNSLIFLQYLRAVKLRFFVVQVLLGLCKLQILNGFLVKCQILIQLILELSELAQIKLGEVKGLTIWFAG